MKAPESGNMRPRRSAGLKEDPKFVLGTTIRKEFDGEFFIGEVTKVEKNVRIGRKLCPVLYKIKYLDDDSEEMEEKEVEEHLFELTGTEDQSVPRNVYIINPNEPSSLDSSLDSTSTGYSSSSSDQRMNLNPEQLQWLQDNNAAEEALSPDSRLYSASTGYSPSSSDQVFTREPECGRPDSIIVEQPTPPVDEVALDGQDASIPNDEHEKLNVPVAPEQLQWLQDNKAAEEALINENFMMNAGQIEAEIEREKQERIQRLQDNETSDISERQYGIDRGASTRNGAGSPSPDSSFYSASTGYSASSSGILVYGDQEYRPQVDEKVNLYLTPEQLQWLQENKAAEENSIIENYEKNAKPIEDKIIREQMVSIPEFMRKVEYKRKVEGPKPQHIVNRELNDELLRCKLWRLQEERDSRLKQAEQKYQKEKLRLQLCVLEGEKNALKIEFLQFRLEHLRVGKLFKLQIAEQKCEIEILRLQRQFRSPQV